MTVARWLSDRNAGVPDRLAARIAEVIGTRGEAAEQETSAVCIDAADALLRDLLARGSAGRDVALDLLTVDALATYAFEAAAADPSTLPGQAAAAAARFAATAG